MKTFRRNRPCCDWRETLLSLLEEDLRLPSAERDRCEDHLRSCPACAREFKDLRDTLGLLTARRPIVADALDSETLHRKVWGALVEEREHRRRTFRLAPVGGALALVAALVLGLFWWTGNLPRGGGGEEPLHRVEDNGWRSLAEGLAGEPLLLEAVLAEDFPVEDDLDLLIEELTAVELDALTERLDGLSG